MRPVFHALAATLLFSSSLSHAQVTSHVALRPGQHVTLKIAGDGQVTIVEGGAAREMTEFDLDALATLLESYAEFSGSNAGGLRSSAPAPALAPQVVRVSFMTVPNEQGKEARLLVIENGYAGAFKYRASLLRSNLREPTEVCTVLPHLPTYEHWPYPIAEIDLTDMSLVAWRNGRAPTCE